LAQEVDLTNLMENQKGDKRKINNGKDKGKSGKVVRVLVKETGCC